MTIDRLPSIVLPSPAGIANHLERTLPVLAVLTASALLLACSSGADSSATATAEGTGAVASVTATTEASATATAAASPTPSPTATGMAAIQGVFSAGPQAFPVETGDWTSANGGPSNTRARADSAITQETVGRLDVAWHYYISGYGPYGGSAGAPVALGGVMYHQDLGSNLTAVDLETGQELWRYSEPPVSGPNGPVVADGRVFISGGGTWMAAVDAVTGELLWERQIEKDGFQPQVVGDQLLVGTGALAHVQGNSGFVHALDVATGETNWSFQVVEEGFWGDEGLNSGGGVWGLPAVDLARGLVYLGTGNAGPYPGTGEFPNGSSRPGDNLYTSSLIALNLETGELEWHYQAVPHGLFDHDFQSSPLLATIEVAGGQRDVVIGSGKLGRVVALDAVTHEVVWATEVGIHQNDKLTSVPLDQVVEVFPGIFGGVETPMAGSGDLLFVPVVNLPTVHSATGYGALDGSSALLHAAEQTPIWAGTGELVAIDAQTGEIVWDVELDSAPFGGATVVDDLVFTATYNGRISAHRIEDGGEVWSMFASGSIIAWPAVQHDTILWPIGYGSPPEVIALRLAPEAAAGE